MQVTANISQFLSLNLPLTADNLPLTVIWKILREAIHK